MASTPVITSPADNSTQSLPFDLVGTGTVNAIVEARDDAGYLLPATLNPVTVDGAGDWTIHVTSLTGSGTGNKWYAAAGGEVYAAAIAFEGGVFPVTAYHDYDGSNPTTQAVAGVTTAGASILVACFGTVEATYAASVPTGVTGGGLTWLSGKSTTSQNCGGGASIWYAVSSGAQNNITVTATWATAQYRTYGTVLSMIGAASSPIGGTAESHYPGGGAVPVSVATTAQAGGSYIIGMVMEGSTTAPTADANSTVLAVHASGSVTFYVVRSTAATSGAGSTTVGTTAPGSTSDDVVTVEILAA